MKFEYTVKNEKGKTIKSSIEANSRAAALETLKQNHISPNSLRELTRGKKGSLSLSGSGSSKVKKDDLVMFTRQMSAMISAGVPLTRAIDSLEKHSDSPGIKKVANELNKDVQAGTSLGDAMEKHPKIFDEVYVNMVRAGETAGILDDIMKRLAIQQEKSSSIRKKIKSAMTYPMVLIVITILSFFGLMIFVIPQIGEIITDLGGPDAELPILTQTMLAISQFMISFWYILLPLLIGGVWGFFRYISTPSGKKVFHTVVLKIPAINKIITKVAVARFARTFSALIGAGVSVIESLEVTSKSIGNVVFENALKKATADVKAGHNLSAAIEENKMFPGIVSQMLLVGEETGQTDVVLVKVADYYEEEVDVAIDGLSSIIEPVMIVIMGGMVGLVAASVMQPISELSSNIQA